MPLPRPHLNKTLLAPIFSKQKNHQNIKDHPPLHLPRLLLLTLATSALAAPQLPYMPYHGVYQPMVYGHPSMYAAAYPTTQYINPYAGHAVQYAHPATIGRNIWPISFSGAQTAKGTLDTATSVCGGTGTAAGTSACTVTGEVEVSQNGIKDLICGNNGGLTINMQGSGMKANNKYKVYLVASTTCAYASTDLEILEFTTPGILGANSGVNLYYCLNGYNVDGANGKTAVNDSTDYYVIVRDANTSTETTVGCTTSSALA